MVIVQMQIQRMDMAIVQMQIQRIAATALLQRTAIITAINKNTFVDKVERVIR